MNEDRYERTIDELEPRACKWWPKEVRDEAQESQGRKGNTQRGRKSDFTNPAGLN